MKLNTLEDLLLHELKDLHSAETQLVKALPKLAKAATNQDLVTAFESHLEETKGHVEKLDKIGEILGKKLTGMKCKAMEGLVEEGSEMVSEDAEDSVRDVGLIGAAQRVEHYEMAGYGTAATIARQLGHDDVAELLGQILEEEKAADAKLTEIAVSKVNVEAESAAEAEK